MWAKLHSKLRGDGKHEAALLACVALCSIGYATSAYDLKRNLFSIAILAAGYLCGVFAIGAIKLGQSATTRARTAAWRAAFFRGLLVITIAAMIVALIENQHIVGVRPLFAQRSQEEIHHFTSDPSTRFFILTLVAFAALCAAFSAGAFVRSWTRNNLLAALAWIVILPAAIQAVRFVEQQNLDLEARDCLPLIFGLAALLALSGWICFSLTPAAWTSRHRCISAGVPLIIVLLYIWVSLLRWDVDRWSKPALEQGARIRSATVVSHGLVELHIRDFRSGDHTFALGGESGRRRYLGRNAAVTGTSFSIKGMTRRDEVFYSRYCPGQSSLGHVWNLTTHADSSLPEFVLPRNMHFEGEAPEQIEIHPEWSTTRSQHWRLAAASCGAFGDSEFALDIFNESGECAFQIPIASLHAFHELDDGRIFTVRRFIAEPALKWSTKYATINLETKNQSNDNVEGGLLAVSGNAQKMIVLNSVDGAEPRALALELVDLAAHERRVLLSPAELASTGSTPRLSWEPSDTKLCTTSDFMKLICLTGERVGEFQKLTLRELNLDTGEKRVIADASALPVIFVGNRAALKRERRDDHDTFEIEQLFTDETSAVLRIGQYFYSVELSSGKVTPWFDPAGMQTVPQNRGHWFSPSATRAVFEVFGRPGNGTLVWPPLQADTAAATIEQFAAKQNRGDLTPEPGLYVFEPGKRPWWIGSNLCFAGWLDEKRVIACDESKCFVITLEDLSRRELFSIEDPDLTIDHW